MSSYADSLNFQLVNGGLIANNTMLQNCYSSGGCQTTGSNTYQQPVAMSIEGSTNVAVQNNNAAQAAQVLEIDSNNNGQSIWKASSSAQITQCGNIYGAAVAPVRQAPC
jgi:hypothetical protein